MAVDGSEYIDHSSFGIGPDRADAPRVTQGIPMSPVTAQESQRRPDVLDDAPDVDPAQIRRAVGAVASVSQIDATPPVRSEQPVTSTSSSDEVVESSSAARETVPPVGSVAAEILPKAEATGPSDPDATPPHDPQKEVPSETAEEAEPAPSDPNEGRAGDVPPPVDDPPTSRGGDFADDSEPHGEGEPESGSREVTPAEEIDAVFGEQMELVVDSAKVVVEAAGGETLSHTRGRIWGFALQNAVIEVRTYRGISDLPSEVTHSAERATLIGAEQSIAYCAANPERPEQLATEPRDGIGYTIDEKTAHPPQGGTVTVATIHEYEAYADGTPREGGATRHLVTATSIEVPPDGERGALYAKFYSHPDGVVVVEDMIAMSPEQDALYDRAILAIPDDALVGNLVNGEYRDEVELGRNLALARMALLVADQHSGQEIDQLVGELGQLAREVHADRAQNHGLRHDRLRRMVEYMGPLFG